MSSSSPLLERLEIETAPEPTACVIWLHGLGADGNDFVPVVPALGLPEGSAVRFIFPNAPTRPITVNGGMVMRGWYDILGMDIDRSTDADGIRQSAQSIAAIVAHEVERGIPSEKIVLAGFSQGGAIALQAGLTLPHNFAGIMALSTYLSMSDEAMAAIDPVKKASPIFMAHGALDDVIQCDIGERSSERLTANGLQVEWHKYNMPHSVSQDEVDDMSAWLKRLFGM